MEIVVDNARDENNNFIAGKVAVSPEWESLVLNHPAYGPFVLPTTAEWRGHLGEFSIPKWRNQTIHPATMSAPYLAEALHNTTIPGAPTHLDTNDPQRLYRGSATVLFTGLGGPLVCRPL